MKSGAELANANPKLFKYALNKYSSPYGKPTPETYAYLRGLLDNAPEPANICEGCGCSIAEGNNFCGECLCEEDGY